MKIRDIFVGILLVLLVVVLVNKEFSSNDKEIILGDSNIVGDINDDGKVNSSDYMLIRRHILSNPALTGTSLTKADLNKDGKINAADYIIVRKLILGISVSLPVSTPSPTPTPKPTATPTPKLTPTPTPQIIPVSSISINKSSITLDVGEGATLTATVSPSNATDKTVTWSSSDTSVVTVNNGLIKGVKAGTATITAKSNNGKTSSCKVTVTIPVTGITLDKTTASREVGLSITISATINPSNASNQTVKWTISDTSVASVQNSGKTTVVIGKKVGTATVTATTNNGKTATCKVTIVPQLARNIVLNKTNISILRGKAEQLTATVEPSNAENKTVTWTSSNPDVATVSSTGLVTGKKASTSSVIITAQTSNGIKTTCLVSVKPVNEWFPQYSETGNRLHHYYDANGEMYVNKWLEYNSKKYYFGADGYPMEIGWHKIGSDWYYFGERDSSMSQNKLVSPPTNTGTWGLSYVGADGKLYINKWAKVNGYWYYFGADGILYYSKTVTIDGKSYKFDGNGHCTNCNF